MDAPERGRLAAERLAEQHEHLIALLPVDADPTAASSLPGWTLGHLMTHLARNADSVVRRLEAARRGQVVEQYVGGDAGREAEIAQGATREWGELRDDVIETARAIDALAPTLADRDWSVESLTSSGERMVAARVLERRIREVVIHRFDLGLGPEPHEWPAYLVEDLLDSTLSGLAGRTDPAQLAIWAIGRGAAPRLAPW